jgi:predicted RNA-binding protein YlqC (UPF0109 family)
VSRVVLEFITPWLVDKPADVEVAELEGDGNTSVLELSVHQDDVGKVIGKRGRMIRSIRTLSKAAGQREGKNYSVEVVD